LLRLSSLPLFPLLLFSNLPVNQVINIMRYIEVVQNLPAINKQGGANGKATHYLAEFGTLGVNLMLSIVSVIVTR
jgi:hypothetical protein